MFDLENAVAEWRQQLVRAGLTDGELLSELESHLRDDIDQQMGTGTPIEAAYTRAVQQLGQAAALGSEFKKMGRTRDVATRAKSLVMTLAGIPSHYTEGLMTAPQTYGEPRWATYLKSLTFLLPAICLWGMSVIFLLPKLEHIAKEAGSTPLPSVITTMMLVTRNGWLILGAIVLMVGLLEWRSTVWPRYRRAVVGVGTFLVNGLVLVSIFMMVLTALIIAPSLMKAASGH